MSDRMRILETLIAALEPLPNVIAFWEAGSRATGRYDELSDLDLQCIVADGTVEATRRTIEAALQTIAPFQRRWEVPQPAWHGHWQAFYHLKGTDPLLLVDLVIMERKAPGRFLEPEQHGIPTVFFDREGLTRAVPTDSAAYAERLRRRLAALEEPLELFHPFVDKELRRGREVDAFSFYHGTILLRLVEVLRMRYSPWRYNFGLRYLQYDLPPAIYAQVQAFVYVASPADLGAKKAAGLELIRSTIAELKALDFVALLEQTRP
ncbi:MAG: polymerase beta domain protein region [Symbiobacteriaceae bacterium]|jgi:hypothetical protein|nr:polymerase beta domain protein region [Symbiobacteriaceae bacterium]